MPRPRVTEADVVLDAAAGRLASHGIADTTVDDVAAAAGVSRATVYRYTGGKDEIVQAVIDRETEALLARLQDVVTSSVEIHTALSEVVSTALTEIEQSPVLGRLASTDLRESLPFVTIDAAGLVGIVVSSLSGALRAAPQLAVDDGAVDAAVEELTRFVLSHITTPRRDGSRLGAREAGLRAAALVGALLEPLGGPD